MYLGKPRIEPITPIDKAVDNDIDFWITDGPELTKSELTLYDVATQEPLWRKQKTYGNLYSITITSVDAADLEYNKKYAVTITAYAEDELGQEVSSLSDKVYFWVYSTPEFYFDNIVDGDYFTSSNIRPDLVYRQAQGESLDIYNITLYDSDKNEIESSGNVHSVTQGDIAYHFRYNFVNLDNNASYYIRAIGETVEDTLLDTGYVGFSIEYTIAEGSDYLKLESDDYGTVHAKTNIIALDPEESPSDITIEHSQVQLLDKSLTYDSNYSVNGNFTLSLKMTHTITRSKNPNTILTMRNGSHNIRLTSYVYDDDTLRYHLIVNNGLCDANYYSDALNVTDRNYVVVHIRRINDMYQLEALEALQLD